MKVKNVFFVLLILIFTVVVTGCDEQVTRPTINGDTLFQENMLPVRKDSLYGYVDNQFNVVIAYQFQDARPFHNGVAVVKHNDLYHIIDTAGTILSSTGYDVIMQIKNQPLLTVMKNNLVGAIDINGTEIIPLIYQNPNLFRFYDGLSAIKIGDKSGYIDLVGNITIPAIYDQAQNFSYGFAVVSQNGLYGIINLDGEIVIPLTYSYHLSILSSEHAIVKVDTELKLINMDNEQIFPSYEYLVTLGNLYFAGTYAQGYIYDISHNKVSEQLYHGCNLVYGDILCRIKNENDDVDKLFVYNAAGSLKYQLNYNGWFNYNVLHDKVGKHYLVMTNDANTVFKLIGENFDQEYTGRPISMLYDRVILESKSVRTPEVVNLRGVSILKTSSPGISISLTSDYYIVVGIPRYDLMMYENYIYDWNGTLLFEFVGNSIDISHD